ncbi:hypothetical protein hamaS1_22370 [Moorella sp. Hama-1]|nr:hypothetical protein hamaS1_22370 [Moorella sp. Hama-1]
MRFVTLRELRLKSGEIWRQLQKEGEMVITSNGKPVAVLSKLYCVITIISCRINRFCAIGTN